MGEASIVSELFLERLNYCIYVILLMIGLWAMLAKQKPDQKIDRYVDFSNCYHFVLCFHSR